MTKDAFAQGKLAFEHNHAMSSCEYPVGSSLRAEWMAGWTQASNNRPNGQSRAAVPPKDNERGAEHRL